MFHHGIQIFYRFYTRSMCKIDGKGLNLDHISSDLQLEVFKRLYEMRHANEVCLTVESEAKL